MTYARARLLLGISGVGTIVFATLVALLLRLPERLLPHQSEGFMAEILAFTLVVAFYVALSFPFDLFGGYLLPRRHQRHRLSLGEYLATWFRGVVVHSLCLVVIGLVILWAGRLAGLPGAIAGVSGIALLLLRFQEGLARLLGRLNRENVTLHVMDPGLRAPQSKLARVLVVAAKDPGFTGGIVGIPGQERIVIPAQWRQTFSSIGLRAQLMRRFGILDTGSRWRGVLIALLWNVLGFGLAARLPGAAVDSVAGIITIASGSTLWSFIGLLLLPSLNRSAVFAADQVALWAGSSQQLLSETFHLLDQSQDDEPSRAVWIERIFHPIPSLRTRLESLQKQRKQRKGAWQSARLALFLSWSTLGFLSRAVHCNSGRPELWVLLPSD